MPAKSSLPAIPLPRGWPSRVKSVILHVISLAQFSLAYTRGWAANFEAPVLAELWKYFSRFAGTDNVYHVRGQSEVRKLAHLATTLRLVIVHARRLHNPVAWAIQLATPSDGEPAHSQGVKMASARSALRLPKA